MSRRLRPGALVLLTGLLVLSVAASAWAHPFGPPPTALIAVRDTTVLIEWRSAPDDAVAVGVHLGFFDEAVLDAYLEAPTQAAPPAADEDALTTSPELLTYLAEHVTVRQDGQRCEVAVIPPTDFVHAGARVLHDCPAPVEVIEVELTMLHDIHGAYRTFGIVEDETATPSQVVFSVATPRHTIDLTGRAQGPDARTDLPLAPLLVASGLVLSVGGAAALRLRRTAAG